VLLSVLAAAAATAAPAPKVVFIGDTITYNWVGAFAANHSWINRGSSAGAFQNAANQILARFQTEVIDLHPAIVHILAGTEDVALADDASYELTVQDVQRSITAMVTEANKANIRVVLGTIPPLLTGESGPIVGVFQPVLTLQINAWIEGFGLANHIPVVNYHDALCVCVGSTDSAYSSTGMFAPDDLLPSVTGYAAMTSLAETAIATIGLELRSGYLGNVALAFEEIRPQSEVNTVQQGTSVQFTAYGVYAAAGETKASTVKAMTNTNFAGLNGTWTSSDPSVMYVGYSGVAFAASPGKATISFTSLDGLHFSPWVMTVLAGE
jgi:lysophospholipase L1-like esterase